MRIRRLILDAHDAVRLSLHARTRRLQLKHGYRAMELLNEAFQLAPDSTPDVRDRIPESAAHPTTERISG